MHILKKNRTIDFLSFDNRTNRNIHDTEYRYHAELV